MQLTNNQISAVSLWMKEHGIDEHLIGVFEKEWMKSRNYCGIEVIKKSGVPHWEHFPNTKLHIQLA